MEKVQIPKEERISFSRYFALKVSGLLGPATEILVNRNGKVPKPSLTTICSIADDLVFEEGGECMISLTQTWLVTAQRTMYEDTVEFIEWMKVKDNYSK